MIRSRKRKENISILFSQRFQSSNINQDLGLSLEEFLDMMMINEEKSKFLCKKIFDIMNISKNGLVTFEEYLQFFGRLVKGKIEDKALITFQLIEGEKNGRFSKGDLVKFLESLIPQMDSDNQERTSKARILSEFIFEKFGVKRSEFISFDDFLGSIKEDPGLLELFDFAKQGFSDKLFFQSKEKRRLEKYDSKLSYLYRNLIELKNEREKKIMQKTLGRLRFGLRRDNKHFVGFGRRRRVSLKKVKEKPEGRKKGKVVVRKVNASLKKYPYPNILTFNKPNDGQGWDYE